MIHVSVEIDTPPDILLSDAKVRQIARYVFEREKIDSGNLTVVFTSDENLRKMKQQYFNIDAYTDVIAFNLEDPGEPIDGEIYISPERAEENSHIFGVTPESELHRLVVHGTLHLLGYDDEKPEDQKTMKQRENQYLSEVYSPDKSI